MFIVLLSLIGCFNDEDNQTTELILITQDYYLSPAQSTSYQLIAIDNDNNISNVTSQAEWSSNNTDSVQSSTAGSFTALTEGFSNISANYQGMTETTSLIVTDSVPGALFVTANKHTVQQGTQQQYTATLILTNNTTIDVTTATELKWTSGNSTLADIDTTGLLTAQSEIEGDVLITASYNKLGLSHQYQTYIKNVNVSHVELSTNNASIPLNHSDQITTKVIFTDGSSYFPSNDNQFTFTSEQPSVFHVDNYGKITANKVGSSAITANYQSGQQNITSTNSITYNATNVYPTKLVISPKDLKLPFNIKKQLVATTSFNDGNTINVAGDSTWTSSNNALLSVASTGNTQGKSAGYIEGKNKEGSVVVNASYTNNSHTVTDKYSPSLLNDVTSINITAKDPNLNTTLFIGGHSGYQVIMTHEDASTSTAGNSIHWISSNPTVASISPQGEVKGLTAGKTTITATYNAQIKGTLSASKQITVISAVPTALSFKYLSEDNDLPLLMPRGKETFVAISATMSDGSTHAIAANDKALSWSFSANTPTGVLAIDGGGLLVMNYVPNDTMLIASYQLPSSIGGKIIQASRKIDNNKVYHGYQLVFAPKGPPSIYNQVEFQLRLQYSISTAPGYSDSYMTYAKNPNLKYGLTASKDARCCSIEPALLTMTKVQKGELVTVVITLDFPAVTGVLGASQLKVTYPYQF